MIYCSFCGGSSNERTLIIAGEDARICDLCIEYCRDMGGVHREKQYVIRSAARHDLCEGLENSTKASEMLRDGA